MIDEATLRAALQHALATTDLTSLPALRGAPRYVGKVRDNYSVHGKRVVVVTDRISAFDVVLGTIPFKGQVLNRLAAFWFETTRDAAPNHLVAVPDPNVTIAVACQPLPVEFVVRAYLTGVTSTSIWRHYEQGARSFCGHALPGGMKKNEPLPAPILTPSTKAPKGGHDESLSRADVLARGLVDPATFDEAERMVMKLFAVGQAHAARQGLILADTKYELGLAGGKLMVIDEMHTPDSSRYWYAADYEQRLRRGDEPRALDKEYVRRWYAAQGYTGDGPPPPLADDVRLEAARRYVEAYELVTGTQFVPETSEPATRIARNVERYFQA